MLKYRVGNLHLRLTNPSAYYLHASVQYQRGAIDNVMIAPKRHTNSHLPTGAQGSVTFQTVNDYGAVTSATASLG